MGKLLLVWDLLKGKKTYIVGGLMVLLGLLQGDQKMVFDGLGFITLRLGIPALQSKE